MTPRNHSIPVLTLLTDFGNSDHYVAAMKGVILGICPTVHTVDVSHEVKAFDIAEGAYTLSQVWQLFPEGTVHLVVVDPGVGSSRRAIAASVCGHYFVGPDNGVLAMALGEAEAKGEAVSVRQLTSSEYFHHPVSQTFHGRDIFAPVAAHLACGVAFEEVGPVVEDWFRPAFLNPLRTSRRSWSGTVLKVDRFGNLITNYRAAEFPLSDGGFSLRIGLGEVDRLFNSYAEAENSDPFLICGSGGFWEVVVKEGDAASRLGVRAGAPIELQS